MKRFNGTGCIRHLKGNRKKPFQAVVTEKYNKKLKKQKFKSIGTFETFIDAELALCKYLKNSDNTDKNYITLHELYKNFIAFKNNKISENTLRSYNNLFKKLKSIENKHISDVKLTELQNIVDPLSPCYQKNLKTFIVILFNFALKNDYILENKARYIELKKYRKTKMNVFTKEEIYFIKKKSEDFYKTIMILLYTGMRISELLDLKINDIELEEKIIYINKSKTLNGVRFIPIHQDILDIIICLCDKNNIYLLEKKGKKIKYTEYYTEFKREIKNHNIHELRHTFVTNCSECDMDLYITKLLTGHSLNDLTLNTYTHLNKSKIIEEFKKFNYK